MAERTNPFAGRTVGTGCGVGIDREQARRALAVFGLEPYQIELRPLPSARSVVLPAGSIEALVDAADAMERDGNTVYLVLNPVTIPGPARAARDADVVMRRWLFFDLDPVKAQGAEKRCATDEEKAHAGALAASLAGWLCDQGWPQPIQIDSGNGYYLDYLLEQPNDEHVKALVRRLVKTLKARFDSEHAVIDGTVTNAARLAKLPGTLNRKGEDVPERPHRRCRFIRTPDDLEPVGLDLLRAVAGVEAAPVNGAATHGSPFQGKAKGAGTDAYGRKALAAEVGRVFLAIPGPQEGRNNALFRASAALSELVGGGVLSAAEVESSLLAAATAVGLDEAEARRTIESGRKAGSQHPRGVPQKKHETNGTHASRDQAAAAEPEVERTADDVAGISDLAAAGATLDYLWPLWLQRGVLTALAAEGGKGKTRFCMDLLRRIRAGLPWPDGAPMLLPPDSLALWVIADNNHDEIVSVASAFGVADGVKVNAWKEDPFGGTSLDDALELAALDRRIALVKPQLVVVDTVGNSTDRNLSRQEEAKAYYEPLQVIARRRRVALLCLTHLNATGKFLGRRVLEKVRVALQMSKPSASDERRRLWVHKSFDRHPPPLGVTMTGVGNDYDPNPPEEPAQAAEPGQMGGAQQRAVDWLTAHLESGPKPVGNTRTLAESQQIATGSLYRARDFLHVEEYEMQGRKWWRLPASGEEQIPE